MKRYIVALIIIPTTLWGAKKPHKPKQQHQQHVEQAPEKQPDPQHILANIFGIILNGMAIAQGNGNPDGQNHMAIAQHVGAIIHEFNKIYPGKNLSEKEIVEALKKLKIPERITQRSITTHVTA